MRALILYLLLFIAANSVYGTIIFRSGRRNHGNIGAPGDYDMEDIKPAWFSQKLDHTNPSDLRTWDQVRIMKLPNHRFN